MLIPMLSTPISLASMTSALLSAHASQSHSYAINDNLFGASDASFVVNDNLFEVRDDCFVVIGWHVGAKGASIVDREHACNKLMSLKLIVIMCFVAPCY